MPCNSVAVAAGRLTTNIAAILKEDENVARALVAYIESITKARPVNINTKLTGYVEISVGYDAIVTINDNSEVRLRSVRLTRRDLEDLSTKVTTFADQLGRKMGPERAIKAIKRRYGADAIIADQTMGKGARVVKIRI